MPSFTTRRRVAFTPLEMFDLVADVEQYPLFVPLCEGLIVKQREKNGSVETVIAEMQVGYRAIHERFTSRVRLERERLAVTADLVEGPFRRLENRWGFHGAPGGSDVEFHIDYEFNSLMLQLLAGAVFEQAFRRFTEAFEARAKVVYGERA
jgi:coenzyme Q-binding protein COQ10